MSYNVLSIDALPAIVIHDDSRADRKLLMAQEFPKFFGPDKEIRVQPAIKERWPAVAITRAHQACVRWAKECNFPYVLVMEDDVKFLDNARSYIDYHLNHISFLEDDIEKNGHKPWDMLLGGVYTIKIARQAPLGWAHVDFRAQFSGTHFYIMKSTAYDRFLNLDPSKTLHVDKWFGANLECYVSWPMFALQHAGYSDQKERYMNYDHLLTRLKTIDSIKTPYWTR